MTHFRIQLQKRFYAHLTDLALGNVDVSFCLWIRGFGRSETIRTLNEIRENVSFYAVYFSFHSIIFGSYNNNKIYVDD